MNARVRLEEWFRRLGLPDGQMLREDVCFVMVQTRHLIETAPSPEQFPVARFYADWVVHASLDRSTTGLGVLRDITRVIAENFAQTHADFTGQVSRVVGLPALRSEMRTLFEANGLPPILFDYRDNWRSFAMFLLWMLEGQEIGFPANPSHKAQVIREEMFLLDRPHQIAVEALQIVRHNGVYHWRLQVSGEKEFQMLGPVELAERETAFVPPADA